MTNKPFVPIRTSRDFRRVYARGGRGGSDGVAVFALATAPEQPCRLGLSIRSSFGPAVARNRARRRLREAFRACAPAGGCDVVIHAQPEVLTADFEALVDHLRRSLAVAGVNP